MYAKHCDTVEASAIDELMSGQSPFELTSEQYESTKRKLLDEED